MRNAVPPSSRFDGGVRPEYVSTGRRAEADEDTDGSCKICFSAIRVAGDLFNLDATILFLAQAFSAGIAM
jgi:hypothetical protein